MADVRTLPVEFWALVAVVHFAALIYHVRWNRRRGYDWWDA